MSATHKTAPTTVHILSASVGHCSGVIRVFGSPRARIDHDNLYLKILRAAPGRGKDLNKSKSAWPFFPADSVIPTGET
jgi:hypothetical protein